MNTCLVQKHRFYSKCYWNSKFHSGFVEYSNADNTSVYFYCTEEDDTDTWIVASKQF